MDASWPTERHILFGGHCDPKLDLVSRITVSGAYILNYSRQESLIWCVDASLRREWRVPFWITVTLTFSRISVSGPFLLYYMGIQGLVYGCILG